MDEAHLLPSFGLAPLITSFFSLLTELAVRWVDRRHQKFSHQQAKYFTKRWYLICQLFLFAFAASLGIIGFVGSRGVGPYSIEQNNLAYSIASYQVVLMQITLLQMYLLRNLFSPLYRRARYFIALQYAFAIIQLAGGVLSIPNVVPRIHELEPWVIGGLVMNVGGGGYFGTLGIRALWTMGNQDVWLGIKTIVRWSRGKPLPVKGEVVNVNRVRWRGPEVYVNVLVRKKSSAITYDCFPEELAWLDFKQLRGAINGLEKLTGGLYKTIQAVREGAEPMRKNASIVDHLWDSNMPVMVLGPIQPDHVAIPRASGSWGSLRECGNPAITAARDESDTHFAGLELDEVLS
ncbi:hypothetical protein K458DRAFT_387243 [Lentithecium fluviatile CBS 122367]|uniref:Uncharacterized protein n=1 Tax=Lentithecium fluviatile CBS 122367 TaxID=1168545 RepID=A0A6G1J758_9PLEO|nr:hypothetical protein K458DRAFT_387243 [Lentithecium fluviatile CBS 122367]